MSRDLRENLRTAAPGMLEFGGTRMTIFDVLGGFWGIRRQLEMLLGKSLTNSVLQAAGVDGGGSFARHSVELELSEHRKSFHACLDAYQAAGFGHFEIIQERWPLGSVSIRAADAFEAWMFQRRDRRVEHAVCAYSAGVLVGFLNEITGRRDVICTEVTCQALGDEFCTFKLAPGGRSHQGEAVMFASEGLLGGQLNLLEILFERMPMGVALYDRKRRVQRFNPTWGEMVERYTPARRSQITRGASLYDLAPGTKEVLEPIFEGALAGQTVRNNALRLESGGRVGYLDSVASPLSREGEIVGVANVIIDVTARTQALEELRETQRMLTTLMGNLPGMAYRCKNDAQWTMLFVSQGVYDLTGYQPADLVHNRRVAYADLIHPGDRERVAGEVQAAVQRGIPFQTTYRIITANGEQRWVWEQGCAIEGGGDVRHLEGFITDFTEKTITYQRLEEQVERQTDLLATVLEVAQSASGELELEHVLQRVARGIASSVGVPHCWIYRFEAPGERLLPVAGVSPTRTDLLSETIVDTEKMTVLQPVLKENRPIGVQMTEKWSGTEIHSKLGVKSMLAVPISRGDRLLAVALVMSIQEPQPFNQKQVELAWGIANTVAATVENARLYQKEQRKRREAEERREVAEGLREILEALNRDIPMQDLHALILQQAVELLGFHAGVLYRFDGHTGRYVPGLVSGIAPGALPPPLPLEFGPAEWSMIDSHPPYDLVSVSQQLSALEKLTDAGHVNDGELAPFRMALRDFSSATSIPLTGSEGPFGLIALYHHGEPRVSAEKRDLMQIFSNQISLAIMNRELRSRARSAAAQEERSRLARDLHDSVTQTLFSASMIAGVLPELWAQDEAAGQHRLEQVQQLTRGALAEMRALLLELRPEGLIEAELGVLLRQLSEALSGRRKIEIELSAHSSCPMPGDVKVAYYRIAQEALNNVEKHAQASRVELQLTCADGEVQLRITDDGRGFDPEAVTPDNMGLRIMRERADAAGADLKIESELGVGTELVLRWDRSWQEDE